MIEIIVHYVTLGGKEYTSEPIKANDWTDAGEKAVWDAIWHKDPTVIIKGIERTDI